MVAALSMLTVVSHLASISESCTTIVLLRYV